MSNLYESQTERSNGNALDNSPGAVTTYIGQNWTPTLSYTIWQIQLKLNGSGTSYPDVLVNIYLADGSHEPTGDSLGQATISGDNVPDDWDWVVASFSSGVDITADTEYVFVVSSPDGSSTDSVVVGFYASDNYAGGYYIDRENGIWNHRAIWDVTFKIEGLPRSAPPATDSYSTKKLVVAASNEIWYESSSGTMSQLADSVGQLDTTDYFDMFELFGKIFIVNNTIKKVVDFANVKLHTTDIVPAGKTYPLHNTRITGGTSGAQMIVDYITALDGDTYIYGKRITTATFESGDVCTATIDEGDVSFTLDADEVAGPHFYNWTSYGNDSTVFGSLPDKITLGCNYMGRAALAGDLARPHQWYMSRQGNPWDWIYGVNDALSAVAGNDADAGECGDVIRTIIPVKDDYLLHGGENSIWYIIGNPCDGGSIEPFDLSTGIYGTKAWCFDKIGQLYFWGKNGLYKTAIPGQPVCISEIKLPDLVNDEAANTSTHRIVLSLDSRLNGILINITTLSDGTNSNYWYDLRALDDKEIGGYFPEEYPEECGVFSTFYYESKDPDYRKLLLGCNDGYIRVFDIASLDDILTDDTTETIDSYVDFGPIAMANDPKFTGKLIGLFCETGGGASSGSESDSDDIYYKIFTAKSASEVIEKLSVNSSPIVSGTFKAPGRQHGSTLRKKIKNVYMGIKLGNNTSGESWAFEQLLYDLKKSGKFK